MTALLAHPRIGLPALALVAVLLGWAGRRLRE